MRKVIILVSVGIVLSSCGTTPEKTCDCIKRSANDFISRGVKPESIDDLREPCKDKIDGFKDDSKGRAMIESCGDEVLENLKNKVFNKIDGEVLPDYPSYIFGNTGEFRSELGDNDMVKEYKYWKTHIVIKEVYFSSYSYRSGDSVITFDGGDMNGNGSLYFICGRDKVDTTKFGRSIFHSMDGRDVLWDTKECRVVESKDFHIPEWMENIIEKIDDGGNEIYDGDGMWFTKDINDDGGNVPKGEYISRRVNYIVKQKGFESFVDDMKTGRYKVISADDMDRAIGKDKHELYLTKGCIKGDYLGYKSVSKMGISMSGYRINNVEVEKIERVAPPSLFTTPGKSIDLSSYVK